VIRKDAAPPTQEIQRVFQTPLPFPDVSIVIQYWLFYDYNDWSQQTLLGQLSERHEADWEAVTIGLSTSKPLFLALSAHCGGEWREWRPDQIDGMLPEGWFGPPKLATHPIVYVAPGSHANYFGIRKHEPDWESCKDFPASPFAMLSYLANVRDDSRLGFRYYAKRVKVVTADDPPMSFPGYWGIDAVMKLQNQRTFKLVDEAPLTPPCQKLWKDPLGVIFCDGDWTPKDRCRRNPDDLPANGCT
jgi:hypothetical protein